MVLFIIAAIAILDSLNNSEVAEGLQKEKEMLVKKVKNLEKEFVNSSNLSDELFKENKQLKGEFETLKSPIQYQDFAEAINVIEAYKASQSFEEAIEFIAFNIGYGYFTADKERKCPCAFDFNGKGFEWIPNAVLDLKEFRIEKDKIYLTYNTVQDVKNNYKFVMTKAIGKGDEVKGWKIEEFELEEK